jgi:hypothetical protein
MERSQHDEIRPLSFARLCLDEALRTSTEKADWIVLIAGALLGPFGLLVPRWETRVTHLLLVAPLSALSSVLVFRLLVSPLLVYRKRDFDARSTEAALSETIAEREGLIRQRDDTIRTLTERPKRTPAEQHDYETAKECLRILGKTAVGALRYLRNQGTLTFNFGGCTTPLPAELKVHSALWVYNHCVSEGVVTCKTNLGNTEKTFAVSPKMQSALDELLF